MTTAPAARVIDGAVGQRDGVAPASRRQIVDALEDFLALKALHVLAHVSRRRGHLPHDTDALPPSRRLPVRDVAGEEPPNRPVNTARPPNIQVIDGWRNTSRGGPGWASRGSHFKDAGRQQAFHMRQGRRQIGQAAVPVSVAVHNSVLLAQDLDNELRRRKRRRRRRRLERASSGELADPPQGPARLKAVPVTHPEMTSAASIDAAPTAPRGDVGVGHTRNRRRRQC